MKNNVLVVGSNSFSGSNFINYLLNLEINVFGVSRSAELDKFFLPYKTNKYYKNFQFHRLDINVDLPAVIDLVKKYKISHVVNFASQSMVAQSWDNPEHWYTTNTLSTIRFHNELKNLDFLDKYLHVSTPEVYGSCSGLIHEHTHYNPSTPYATSRAATDMSLKNFFDAYRFPVVFTRAANVFGEHQQLYRIVPKTILSILTKQKLPLHGGGYSMRSFIHMDDVSDATYKILEKGRLGDIYHISTSRNIMIRELVEMIALQLNSTLEECCDSVDERQGKDGAYLLDSAKLRSELFWEDKISLENGIEKTIRWVSENLNILLKQPLDYIHKP